MIRRYSQLKKHETLTVNLPGKYGDRLVTVFKNPKSEDYVEIAKKFRQEFPFAPKGEPKSRSTYDREGNMYLWMSGDAMHLSMETALFQQLGIETHQQEGYIPEGKFDD